MQRRPPLPWRALSAALLLAAAPATARAQTPGATVEVPRTVTFSTAGQSMWGPAGAPADIDLTFTLFDEGWSESGTAGDVRTFVGTQWGGRISGSTSGGVGMTIRFFDIGTGEVAVDYPVRVVLEVPEPNSFRDGEEIEIASRFEVLPGARLSTSAPAASVQLAGKFGLQQGVDGQVCFGGCSPTFPLTPPFDIPVEPFDLFVIEGTGRLSFPTPFPDPLPNPLVINTLPYEFGALLDPWGDLLGIEGPVDAPRVETTSALDGTALRASGAHTFVDMSLDVDGYLTWTGVPPLGFQSPKIIDAASGATFGYDVAALDLLLAVTQAQSFDFLPRVRATLALGEAVSWTVVDAGGAPVAQGSGAEVPFEVGQAVRLVFPAGRKDAMASTPTYGLDNLFRSRTDYVFDEDLVLSAARFELATPRKSIVETTTEVVCSILGIDAIQSLCELAGGVLQTITHTATTVVPRIDVDLGPLASETLVDESQTVPFFPFSGRSGEWELQGFQDRGVAPFDLDPENPVVAVATSLRSSVLASGGPAAGVTQILTLRNEGDVPLSMARIVDALSAALSGRPFQVLGASSPSLAVLPGFDGGASPELLDGLDVLGVGEEAEVEVLVEVAVGDVYTADVEASGTSPIGTTVTDRAAASLGRMAFEIVPDQVSAWSNGVLPVRLATDGIAAERVDAGSVRLEGVPPDQANLTNAGALILKFPLPEVLAALERRLLSQTPLASVASHPEGRDGGRATVTPAAVAAALLGDQTRLTAVERAVADRLGNGDGRLDLGDLRALVRAAGPAVLAGTGESLEGVAADGAELLVATGLLDDGTPFFGVDDLSVMNGGK